VVLQEREVWTAALWTIFDKYIFEMDVMPANFSVSINGVVDGFYDVVPLRRRGKKAQIRLAFGWPPVASQPLASSTKLRHTLPVIAIRKSSPFCGCLVFPRFAESLMLVASEAIANLAEFHRQISSASLGVLRTRSFLWEAFHLSS
jgi:hypothetical protein